MVLLRADPVSITEIEFRSVIRVRGASHGETVPLVHQAREGCCIEQSLDLSLPRADSYRPLIRASNDWTEHRPRIAWRLGKGIPNGACANS